MKLIPMPEFIKQEMFFIDIRIDTHVKSLLLLNLGGDPWPIYLDPTGKKGQAGIKVELEPGDMLNIFWM